MDQLEALLVRHRQTLERYVRYRMPTREDGEDVLQEVCLTIVRRFGQLKNPEAFLPWALAIARSRCNDFFRQNPLRQTLPMEDLPESALADSRYELPPPTPVEETMDLLGEKDREILRYTFWQSLSQAEIAQRLNIPVGTVKSRLHTAKKNFRRHYPHSQEKGIVFMKTIPKYLPEYTITPSGEPPFPVKWEELPGWFIIPRLGESSAWGSYDPPPSRRIRHAYDMEVTGKAEVHDIEGVAFTARENPVSGKPEVLSRTFVGQLTSEIMRYLAVHSTENGVRRYRTFLDEGFFQRWGQEQNNNGYSVHQRAKGLICREGDQVACASEDFVQDIAGRYTVSIGGKTFDTVCLMEISGQNSPSVMEQYLDHDGRTVLWRRFDREDLAAKRPWGAMGAESQRITVNGQRYVHYCDCATDHIF